MNNTESKEPLYRQLNKERTQGEWKHKSLSNGHEEIQTDTFVYESGNTIFEVNYDNPNYEANAQYTALAVNNLSSLAEALEECIKVMTPYENLFNAAQERAALIQAKEALLKIS